MSTSSTPAYLQCAIRDITEDSASLVGRTIKPQTQWRNTGNGRVTLCHRTDEGVNTVQPFEHRIGGDLDPNRSYFRADGGWTGPGSFNTPFPKIKARGVLVASSIPELRFQHAAAMDELRGLISDDALKGPDFNVGPGASAGAPLIVAGDGITLGHHLMQGPVSTDEDPSERARAQEEENTALGEVFTTPRLPCSSQASRDALQATIAGGNHAARPIPVWKANWSRPVLRDDLEDGRVGGTAATAEEAAAGDAVPTMERVVPAAYDRVLRGATVDVRFTLSRQFIKSSKKYMFLADITAIYVLREAPQVTAKRQASGANFLKSKRVHFSS